jgi:enoyl-CoA hydratase/carnithine racemase
MIDLVIDNGVAHVVLDNPAKLNALDGEAIGELDAAYAQAEASGVRALVLRGEGRAFCAGRDISGVDPRDDDVMGYLGGLVTPLLQRM